MKKTTLKILLGLCLVITGIANAQAPNDNIANAIALTCGSSYTSTTVGATLDQGNPAIVFGVDLDAPNVWYTYTGTGTAESINIDLCTGTSYDSSIIVCTGAPGSLTIIAGNDDFCGTQSNVTFTSDGTTTYYIAIEGYNVTSTGAFTMAVTCTASNPPAVANQTCASALAINVDGSDNNSDNSYGDVSSTQPTCDNFGTIQDVWFSFVAPSATTTCTVTNGTMTSGNFAVYSGTCGTLTGLACSSNFTTSASQALTALTAGATYYVQVWSNTAEQGTFTLNLTDPSLCLPTATFAAISNCPVDPTFNVTADVTSLASASTVTVTDNQGSAPQTISSPSLVTFGPYAQGLSVVLTVTNDQSPACKVVSAAQSQNACPPVNDECANAIALNCGDVLTGQSTNGATGGTSTSCVGTIGDDIWYSYAGDGQVITLTATQTNAEGPQVEVYQSTDGTCSGFAPGTCIASAGSGETTVTVSFVSVAGTNYYVHIGSWINGDPYTQFDLAITCASPATPPANDDCSGAYPLTVNSDSSCANITSGTVNGATASAVDATACTGTADDDVWYSFDASQSTMAYTLSNIAGSSTGLSSSLWTGDCSALTLVPGTCSTSNYNTPTGLVAGQTYYLRIYTTTATALQNTTFDVCVGIPPPPPANDDCTGAVALTAGGVFTDYPVVGTTANAITTTGLTYACQTNRAHDVWYSVVVPAAGSITIETDTTAGTAMTDSVISVFTGDCATLTEVGCDDDNGNGNFSKVALTGLTPGATLYIGVWTYSFAGGGVDGDFQVSAYDASLLSTNSFDNRNFSVYPNPVTDVLNLSYNRNITKVGVYNMLGQEVLTKNVNANQSKIDMSSLAAGTYMVKVSADDQIKTLKVIKE